MREFTVSMVCADIRNKKLRIPRSVWKYAYCMTRPESRLVNQFRSMYPDFQIILLDF